MNATILTETRRPASLQGLVLPIAVLCVQKNNHYRGMEGVEVYDKQRDARTFPGGMPVVAHPPCRAWSAFCRHQAKPEPGEKALGLSATSAHGNSPIQLLVANPLRSLRVG